MSVENIFLASSACYLGTECIFLQKPIILGLFVGGGHERE